MPSTLVTVETERPPARETTTVAPATPLPSGRVTVPPSVFTRRLRGTNRRLTGNGSVAGAAVNTAVASAAPLGATMAASEADTAGETRHAAAPTGTRTTALTTDPATVSVGATNDRSTRAMSSPNTRVTPEPGRPISASARRVPTPGSTSIRSALARSVALSEVTDDGMPRTATVIVFGFCASRSTLIVHAVPTGARGSVTCATNVVTG